MSRRLRAYARRYSWAGMGRVRRVPRVPLASGEGPGVLGIQRPGLLFLPDLPSSPSCPGRPRGTMWSLESSFPAILRDFEAVSWDFRDDSSALGLVPTPWPLGATSSC